MVHNGEQERFERLVAENETRFRAVNEDIERGRPGTDRRSLVPFVCECGDAECRRLIELTPAQYTEVRSDPRTFAVAVGHEIPVAEDVVARHEGWSTVRKKGVGAEVAEREA